MNDFTDEKQAAMMRKVRSLLERADHPSTPAPEAESSRTMAEALMFKYRIGESEAIASGSITTTPIWREVVLNVADSEFATYYSQLAGAVLQHVGCRGVTSWAEVDGKYHTKLIAVGYSADITYMDVLLTSAMMEFGKRLEPKHDPNLSLEDNVYNMRSAGMERNRIAKVVYGDWTTVNEMKQKTRKVTAAFKRACEERGEDPNVLLGRGNSVKTFRKSYAEGFVNQFHSRLWRMRTAQGEESKGLVLTSRKEKVDEAYYLRYPQYRPAPPREQTAAEKAAAAKALNRALNKKYVEPKRNLTAMRRGESAANMVDLGPGATGRGKVSNDSRPEIG